MTRRCCFAALATAIGGSSALPGGQSEPQALLFGTVFRDSYLALPGARVVAYNEASPRKKYRAVTNYRGEYRIRVPAGNATYSISVSAPRFVEAQRAAEVFGMNKTTTNFILEPRKGGKTGKKGSDGK